MCDFSASAGTRFARSSPACPARPPSLDPSLCRAYFVDSIATAGLGRGGRHLVLPLPSPDANLLAAHFRLKRQPMVGRARSRQLVAWKASGSSASLRVRRGGETGSPSPIKGGIADGHTHAHEPASSSLGSERRLSLVWSGSAGALCTPN